MKEFRAIRYNSIGGARDLRHPLANRDPLLALIAGQLKQFMDSATRTDGESDGESCISTSFIFHVHVF